ncbi:hypothetical protein G9C85_05215 [Halorubellus sp. JP-L1]|uniref:hypothetical protein n=1 Tax=Halorubellus sp. JP-L1 TaxID=2715753 RepID=UPI00140B86DD|nr:hypothetical protein [Halorubellus sp. JP-L1]NHN41036.1 hypothetical protein [Halorubellus sp. JP-L1]
MHPSEWSRTRRVLVAVFAFLTAFGASLVAFSPDGQSPTIAFVLLDVLVLYALVFHPEWLPGVDP